MEVEDASADKILDEANKLRQKRRRIVRGIRWTIRLAILFGMAWLFIEPRVLTITEVTIADRDVPQEFDGFTIVHLSDIHYGPYFTLGHVRKIVKKTNQLEPDLILITGDYISRDSKYIEPCFEVLKGLKAKHGAMSVLGNHDYWEGADRVRAAMKKAGIEDLENRAKWIEKDGARIKVGGVEDLWEGLQNIEPTIEDTKVDDFVVLLQHNPDYAAELRTDKVDLMLSGHTHGGQVTVFGLYAPKLPIRSGQRYRGGVVQEGPMTLIISRGIGSITPPVRFFCPPEIIFITLRHSDN